LTRLLGVNRDKVNGTVTGQNNGEKRVKPMLIESLLALTASMMMVQPGYEKDRSSEPGAVRGGQVLHITHVAQNENAEKDSSSQLHGQSREKFSVNRQQHTYYLYTPESYRVDHAIPLVILLGDISTRTRHFIHYVRFNELADANGFIVAYPDMYQAKTLLASAGDDSGVQQATFLRQLIDHIANQRNIRENSIFVAGFSTGGIVVLNSLCHLSQPIAGFAVVAASMSRQSRSHCGAIRQQIPGLFIAGRDDPYIAWQTGDDGISGSIAGVSMDLLPVSQSVEYWTQRNQCDLRPFIEAMPNEDLQDGTSVTRLSYDGRCVSNKPILLYAVTGGGHTWPGNRYQPPFKDAGRTSQDMNASRTIWQFFNNTATQVRISETDNND
jgi:polyhydroxybutyrate depolymerase